MDKQGKVQVFEYVLSKLLEWHKEVNGNVQNDIGYLKSLKLLFFISAVGTSKNSENTLLDSVFDNFVAMPGNYIQL